MSSLAETINIALQAVGPATEDRLRDVIADFNGMNLSGEERLAAMATAVAATAATHHRRHKEVYLDAVKTWSLEIAAELQPPPLRLRRPADTDAVGEAAELLAAGIDSLIEMMMQRSIRTQDRLVTELALVARLLGQHDANTIHQTLHAIASALASEVYMPGEIVMVPLRDAAKPLSRESVLESLAPRGCA
ncbi:MAG TPA: hypothetical protein VGD08_11100 [Stellaceae bacterium]